MKKRHRQPPRSMARPGPRVAAETREHVLRAKPELLPALPHDPALPDRVREDWLAGGWTALQQLDPDTVMHHPGRAELAALQAAACMQLGDRRAGLAHAQRALAWGCDRTTLGRILLAGTRHTLGRASMLARRDTQASLHFERAVSQARLSSEVRRLAQTRRDQLQEQLQQAVQGATQLRRQGLAPAAVKAPAWLVALADRCLKADDLHEYLDHLLDAELSVADDRIHLLMLLSEQMLSRQDRLTALHFLNAAGAYVDGADSALRAELMRRLVALGAPDQAVDLALSEALDRHGEGDDALPVGALRSAYDNMRQKAAARTEHGHELLLTYLERELGRLQGLTGDRQLVLIEIGTTREDVPGQGSTRKLAAYCKRQRIHFITVDMDPHNTRMAQRVFEQIGAGDFEAITMKGEDYLRERDGPTDFVFLDAYDFDHGRHSELRQSRYRKFLGTRIDEQACHQMHLDCATSLEGKLWQHGAVCVDDTWRDQGAWTAKGTLAVPYLLEHGFALVEARNRAALLVRDPQQTQPRRPTTPSAVS